MLFKNNLKTESNINTEEKSIGFKYHQEYKLNRSDRNISWYLTDCCVSFDEKILLQGYYSYNGWFNESYGLNTFMFYVVEKDSNVYLKLCDISKLEEKAEECAYDFFSWVDWYQTIKMGVKLDSYKKYVRDEACIVNIKLDKSEFEKNINKMKEIDFKDSVSELFGYKSSKARFDCIDFVNKNIFYSDDFYLEKYNPYIEFLDYILKETNIKDIPMQKFKSVNNLEEAMIVAIEEEKERIEFECDAIL